MSRLKEIFAIGVMALLLSACATRPAVVEPRGFTLSVSVQEALAEGVEMLAERGYVIRHADAELGRAEAEMAAWPGHYLRLEVDDTPQGAYVAFSGRRGNQPLEPASLDRLLVELQDRLGLAP